MHFVTLAAVAATTLAISSGCRAAHEPTESGTTSPPSRQVLGIERTAPEPNDVVTLQAALVIALARNPELGVFPYNLRAADARLLQASLLPNPQLDAEIEDVGGRGEHSGFDAAQTTVGIDQPIELGGKRGKRTRVAALDKELVQWDYKAARLDVIRDVTRAFVGVLAAQERLTLTERLFDLSEKAQAAVVQRVKAGKDSPVEELRADVALSESRIERQKAQKTLTAARQGLAATWGGRTPVFKSVVGDFYQTPAPQPLAEMTAAIAENPDLARWETEQDRRRAALQLEKVRGVPDVTVGAAVRRYEQTDDEAMVFQLAVPLPLFDRNQGGILAATAELGKARRQYEAAQVKILTALSEATSALAAAYDEVTILRSDVLPKAQRAFEAAQQGYQQGKFDYLHVLDAQRTLFQAQAQYLDSVEAYHKAQADVQRLTGRPLDTESHDGRPSRPVGEPSSQVR
jgi:cobalt-zinc-cadmium efflux system outer membrane protein